MPGTASDRGTGCGVEGKLILYPPYSWIIILALWEFPGLILTPIYDPFHGKSQRPILLNNEGNNERP